jgi:hypothetical protein
MKHIEKYIDHSFEYFNSKKYRLTVFETLRNNNQYNSYLPPMIYEKINREISACIIKKIEINKCVDHIERTVFGKQ